MNTEAILSAVVFILLVAGLGWIFSFSKKNNSLSRKKLQLADLLAATRSELIEAHNRAVVAGYAVMKFEEVEFEFAVEVENEGAAGLKIFLLELGGTGKRKEANTVRVKYKGLANAGLFAPQTGAEEGPDLRRQTGEEQNE